MVMVNLPTAGVDYHVPFGGRKGSSYGPREQGRYAAEFYTTVKTAYTLGREVAGLSKSSAAAPRKHLQPRMPGYCERRSTCARNMMTTEQD
jgi:hypothetical protein